MKPPSESCVICGNHTYIEKFICQDYTVSNEMFGVFACNACGFQVTSPRPEESEMGKYYQSENYVSHSNKSYGLMSFLYRNARKYALNQKHDLLKPYLQGNKILDIGCGTGAFLAFMNAKGYDGVGVEPDATARKNALEIFGILANGEDYLNTATEQSFDLITMWHVLEHVYHLEDRLKQLHKLIKDDGLICIAVPNPDSTDAQYYNEKWAAYDVPRHLYHFRPKDITALFEKYGFDMIGMHPMKLDAYYVSMLSEKYAGTSFSFLKGFFRGWQANQKAKNGFYSSQIYFFEKQGDLKPKI